MRRVLAIALTLTTAMSIGGIGLWPQSSLAAQSGATVAVGRAPSSDDQQAAKSKFQEGEKAYRLGDFQTAASRFEEAYELSGLPSLLYNVGLSHARAFETSQDIKDLRTAKAVLKNFLLEIEKDPSLGSVDEVQTLLDEIDQKIEKQEAKLAEEERQRELARQQAEAAARLELEQQQQEQSQPAVEAPAPVDPGKKKKTIGLTLIGAGSLLTVGGVVAGVFFAKKGESFKSELSDIYQAQADLSCMDPPVRERCQKLSENEDNTRNNGMKANALAFGLGVSLGVVGLASVATGTVMYLKGKRATEAWRANSQSRLRLSPVYSPAQGYFGFSLQRRF